MASLNLMETPFCQFPQTRLWHDLRDHLLKLSGVGVGDCADDPIIGSWIDFTYDGNFFTINAKSGDFVIFVVGTACSDSALARITAHFEPFFEDDAEITVRGV